MKRRHWIGALFFAGLGLTAVLVLKPHDLLKFAERIAGGAIFEKRISHEDIESYIRTNSIQNSTSSKRVVASGPLRVSPVNRRYFMDGNGQIVYLAGAHTWLNLQDGVETDPPPKFGYTMWLNFLESQNHNFFRLWVWEQAKWSVEASSPYYFDPLPYLRTGTTNGLALDGKPKFDLTQSNQAYFDLLRQRVVEAGERGIYVSVMLFNGWSVAYPKGSNKNNNPWLGHPFNARNNVNDVNGDADGDNSGEEVHELSNPMVTALQETYVRKVIDTVNDLDNVLYEISNESHGGSVAWQYHMIDYIHRYEAGKPKQHPVGMTVIFPDGRNADLYASNAEWVSPKGGLHDRPVADGLKVVVADTDHLCGICGDAKWAWMSFIRGENPLFMDQYDDSYRLEGGGYKLGNRNDVDLRKNLGYTRRYAERMNLAAAVPRGDLASSGYALVNPGTEYLVFVPDGGQVTVDLRGTSGDLNVEWLDPATGQTIAGAGTLGGTPRSFKVPFSGSAVLYLVAVIRPNHS
ncbi:MAG: DUF6298 domain-containing protein [Gammaproteobacteria bacterium]|nr:DUF6298 domain-containing protein [Gammaproteobacteria bacterium]